MRGVEDACLGKCGVAGGWNGKPVKCVERDEWSRGAMWREWGMRRCKSMEREGMRWAGRMRGR